MSKTTYIILGIIAVIAIVAAIYFYNKSKTNVVVIQPQPNPNQQTGVWSLVSGLTGVLSNVNWQSIFGGANNNGNGRYTDALSQSNCGGLAHWNAQTNNCEQ